jgi:hypothetical protein
MRCATWYCCNTFITGSNFVLARSGSTPDQTGYDIWELNLNLALSKRRPRLVHSLVLRRVFPICLPVYQYTICV